jgi:polar amino acid transport system substrate-binding protein
LRARLLALLHIVFRWTPPLAALLPLLAPPAHAAAPDELVFCFESENVRPWRTKDGSGLNFELLDRVAADLGLRFRYIGLPWKRCLHELKGNRPAGAIGASYQAERSAVGSYPGIAPGNAAGNAQPDAGKALYVERYVVIRRQGSPVDWNGSSFSRLTGPAGAPLGYSAVSDLRRIGIRVDDGAQTAGDVLHKLAAERVEVAVLQQGETHALLAENAQLRNRLEVLPRPFAEKPYYVLLAHQLVQTQPELAAKFWAAIARARSSPAYRERERRALGER